MPDLVRHILVSPRTWLSIGAFCIGVSFLLGYHLDQRSADRVLARKVGQPLEVLVQDYIPELHKNMINGVHVLGQTAEGETLRVNIGTEEEPRWITVRPVYAVGADFLPLARQHLRHARDARPRPMPRAAAAALRRQHAAISAISGMALAFVVEEAGDTASGPGASTALGVVDFDGAAQLVEIRGAEITGSNLRDTISQALLLNGKPSVPDSLLIAPTEMAVPALTDDSRVAMLRWWLAFGGSCLAIAALIAPRLSGWLARKARKPLPVAAVEAQGSFPAVDAFQPIASQDELAIDEERALSESSPGTQIRRRVSRLTEFAASSFGGVRSPR